MARTSVALGFIVFVLSGCGKGPAPSKSASTEPSVVKPDKTPETNSSAAVVAAKEVFVATGPKPGLDANERSVYYSTPMGNGVLPYDWLRAMKSKATGQPFVDNLQRFGLVQNEANPRSLPIGLALEEPVGVGDMFGKWVGVNCSACHTSQISYNGKTVRVDGGASLFNLDAFYRDMFESLEATLDAQQPAKLIAFLSELLNLNNSYLDEPSNVDRKARLKRVVTVLQTLAKFNDDELKRHEKEFSAKIHSLASSVLDKSAEESAAKKISGVVTGLDPSIAVAKQEVRSSLLTPFVDEVEDLVAHVKSNATEDESPLGPIGKLADEELSELFRDFLFDAGLLKARLDYLKTLKEINQTKQGTTPGPGRIDAFVNARDLIWPDQMIAATSPISFPRIWNLETFEWLHWDADTTSVTQRNIGQAIGMGAVHLADGRSTVLPRNLAKLQTLAEKLTPPIWPEQILGKIDANRTKAGAALYKTYCATCHTTDPNASPTYHTPWDYVRTDPNRLNNVDPNYVDPKDPSFTTLIGDKPFYAALKEQLTVIVGQAYKQWNIDESEARAIEGMVNGMPRPFPAMWQDGRDFKREYIARPLAGIWATPPYLHNGSVPTLDDLLKPQAKRPAKFYVGYREYDPARVGYVSQGNEAKQHGIEFDTAQPGNGNGGHEGADFGTELSDDERAALVEYLKTL